MKLIELVRVLERDQSIIIFDVENQRIYASSSEYVDLKTEPTNQFLGYKVTSVYPIRPTVNDDDDPFVNDDDDKPTLYISVVK